MVKVEVTEQFTLQKFNELKNLTRKDPSKNEKGSLFVGDTFECDRKMADYLTGNNSLNKTVVEVIEIIPEEEIQKAIDKAVKSEEVKPKTTRAARKKK